MKIKDIEKLIDLAKEKGVSNLSYEEDDHKISVSFEKERVMAAPTEVNYVASTPATSLPNVPEQASTPVAAPAGNFKEIKSPFVGTFYTASSPEADPYVKVGDKISSGQVLCIIEAMKIMNEIEAEISGEIVEICVDNETYVEFGQTLFKVK